MVLSSTQNVFSQQDGSQHEGAQQEDYWSVQYGMSFGTGDLNDYISEPSFRGALIEYRKAIKGNLLVGLDIGWNVFYEKKDFDTYTSGTVTVSGVQYRSQNLIPIMISADYFFKTNTTFKPYVGFGIGTIYTERNTDMGQFRLQQNQWHFALKPELGMLYEVAYKTNIKLAAKYYNGFEADSLEGNQNYFSVSAGVTFGL